jgi:hypothetical protein
MIDDVHSAFDSDGFVICVQQGYERLELMHSGRKIAAALKVFLPEGFKPAVAILLAPLSIKK